jgi:DNA-binding PadR family transcriptional regulator
MTDPLFDPAAKKGSAELLILAVLDESELHGYDIAKAIERRTEGLLTFRAASLYPLLYRLEDRGWIHGCWQQPTGERRKRTYRLTRPDRAALASQRTQWTRFVGALSRAAGLGHV